MGPGRALGAATSPTSPRTAPTRSAAAISPRPLSGADPAGDFRKALLRHPKEEAHFFQFKEKRARERAIEWLRSQGVAQ